jgi:hypothetical protein
MATINFGWMPRECSFRDDGLQIEPLPAYASAIVAVRNSLRAKEGWYLPDLQPSAISNDDLGRVTITHADWFSLPQTHQLSYPGVDDDLGEFLVGVLGVLTGLQLVPEGFGHFYRTPIDPDLLNDVYVAPPAIKRLLRLGLDFWLANPTVRPHIHGAIHAHLFGCSYEHDFEWFGFSYSVLDACWRVHAIQSGKKDPSHAERIVELCTAYGLVLPKWAEVSSGSSDLKVLRNEYFHEARWGGRPLGYSSPQTVEGIEWELFWFNTRLLLAVLGDRSEYTKSAITRQGMRLEA